MTVSGADRLDEHDGDLAIQQVHQFRIGRAQGNLADRQRRARLRKQLTRVLESRAPRSRILMDSFVNGCVRYALE